MRNKEQMKLRQLQEEISKAFLPVRAQLFWKRTKEKFTLHEVYFGGAEKISTVFYQ